MGGAKAVAGKRMNFVSVSGAVSNFFNVGSFIKVMLRKSG